MTSVVPAPSDLTDVLRLADWAELRAIVAADQNSAKGDLEQILRQAGTFDGGARPVDEAIEAHCLTVFSVLEQRAKFLGEFYPFQINGGVLNYDPTSNEKIISYTFCLCLAFLGERHSTPGLRPRLMFEELSAYAAAAYLGGEYFVFGTSRSRHGDQTKRFKTAVTEVCKFVGEGIGFRQQAGLAKKDDHVDLVIVKHFIDKGASKIILFGQCASGNHWPSKVSELQPKIFWDHWIQESRVSEIIRSFFIPFDIEKKEWDYYARYAGLMFDRIRIAYWAPQNPDFVKSSKRFAEWIAECIRKL